MNQRPRQLRLYELRRILLANLDDEWRTASDFHAAFKRKGRHTLGWDPWYRIALVLERLANDGEAEIRVRGNRRSFRRAA